MGSRRERVFVTGAGGFVGAHLMRALRGSGRGALGVGHSVGGEEVVALDIRDRRALEREMSAFAPDAVVHLAARSYLPEVYEDPREAFSINVLGSLSVLEAAAAAAPRARVMLVSTCVVYGDPDPGDLPLREDAPLRSVHPYGTHKIGMELFGERFAEEGLDVIVTRPFNHVGAGMDPRISIMHFARQIAAVEAGLQEPVILVGNLDARRDLLDVADVVRAYLLLLDHESPPSPVNVCSGRSVRIGDALEMLLSLSAAKVEVRPDPSRYRPLDVPDLYGDAARLREATGWRPAVPLEETLRSVLDSARREVRG